MHLSRGAAFLSCFQIGSSPFGLSPGYEMRVRVERRQKGTYVYSKGLASVHPLDDLPGGVACVASIRQRSVAHLPCPYHEEVSTRI